MTSYEVSELVDLRNLADASHLHFSADAKFYGLVREQPTSSQNGRHKRHFQEVAVSQYPVQRPPPRKASSPLPSAMFRLMQIEADRLSKSRCEHLDSRANETEDRRTGLEGDQRGTDNHDKPQNPDCIPTSTRASLDVTPIDCHIRSVEASSSIVIETPLLPPPLLNRQVVLENVIVAPEEVPSPHSCSLSESSDLTLSGHVVPISDSGGRDEFLVNDNMNDDDDDDDDDDAKSIDLEVTTSMTSSSPLQLQLESTAYSNKVEKDVGISEGLHGDEQNWEFASSQGAIGLLGDDSVSQAAFLAKMCGRKADSVLPSWNTHRQVMAPSGNPKTSYAALHEDEAENYPVSYTDTTAETKVCNLDRPEDPRGCCEIQAPCSTTSPRGTVVCHTRPSESSSSGFIDMPGPVLSETAGLGLARSYLLHQSLSRCVGMSRVQGQAPGISGPPQLSDSEESYSTQSSSNIGFRNKHDEAKRSHRLEHDPRWGDFPERFVAWSKTTPRTSKAPIVPFLEVAGSTDQRVQESELEWQRAKQEVGSTTNMVTQWLEDLAEPRTFKAKSLSSKGHSSNLLSTRDKAARSQIGIHEGGQDFPKENRRAETTGRESRVPIVCQAKGAVLRARDLRRHLEETRRWRNRNWSENSASSVEGVS